MKTATLMPINLLPNGARVSGAIGEALETILLSYLYPGLR
jgi:hypothetical protein